jgi:rhodanese-related sulfurtransferase
MSSPLDENGLPPGYPFRPAWEVTPRQVKAMRDGAVPFFLIDCRTPQEYAIASIEGAALIPIHEAGIRLDDLKQHIDSKIVIHCHHGGRSLQMTAFLRHQGFKDVHSMAGGIDVWAMDVDPRIARY